MSWLFVTSVNGLIPESTREFTLDADGSSLNLFIVYKRNQFFIYENRCPHTGVSLNWQPDVFFDFQNMFIQCSTHGALFQYQDGLCIRGPCLGDSLRKLVFKLENDNIYVQV